MSAKAHFFSHDFNARNNYKLLELRADYGWEGYGIFWAICEIISENDKPLPLDRLGAVSVALGVPKEFLASFIKSCLDLDIFIETEAGVTSESLEERLDHKREVIRKRSEAGKKSAEARRKKDSVQHELNKCSTNDEVLLSKRNETKQNETKPNNKKDNTADKSASSSSPKPKKSKASAEVRLEEFKGQIRDAGAHIYNSEMLNAFYGYWSEPMQNKHKGLFRWEAEATWGIDRRLSTWAKRSISFNESPYIEQGHDADVLNQKKAQIRMLSAFLSDPPDNADTEPARADYKRLTGKEWVDDVTAKK